MSEGLNNPEAVWWQEKWQTGQTRWDLKGAHPLLGTLMEKAKPFHGGTFKWAFVAGCGRAHDAAALAQKFGMFVIAEDLAPGAIAAAKGLYGEVAGLTLRVGNCSICEPNEAGKFSVIFDRAMLCALRPELRGAYVSACVDRLVSGGLFCSLPFAATAGPVGSGPPFALGRQELQQLLEPRFELLVFEEATGGAVDEKILREWMVIGRKIK